MSQSQGMDSIQVTTQVIPELNLSVITLKGPLVISDMFELQRKLQEDTQAATILDMAGVEYIDSAGVGLLVNAYVSRQKTGRKLGLARIPDRPKTVLRVTRVDTLFDFYNSVDEAKAALGRATAAGNA